MSTALRPLFVDHLVFFVEDLSRSRSFYQALLGPPAETSKESVMFLAGDTRLFFVPAQLLDPAFDKQRIGLNHLAFGVRTLEELLQVCRQLDGAGIHHSGIQIDHYGNREFLWLDDPDGMRVEFYLRPNGREQP
ncbi:MAG: VOC family protein [Silvibacterium sp.]|nr:VOC family protein [Silvibacterium sp.]